MSLLKLFLAVSLPSLGLGRTITGVVIDPDGGVIPGAEAVLTCRGHTELAAADSLGRITLVTQSEPGDCRVRVTHAGFAPYEQPISPGDSAPMVFRLDLAEPRFSVRVPAVQENDRPLDYATLHSVELSGAQLRQISNRTADLIRYAKQVAGAGLADDNIYVDGMPASSLPPAEMIAHISVNADPFSAEFNDGDQNHIEITTKGPDRRLRFYFGGASLGAGGGNPLGAGLPHSSHSSSFGVSGPVPRVPLTFTLNTSLACNRHEEPILATMPGPAIAPVPSSLCADSVLFSAHYEKSENLRINFASYNSRSRGSNTNVGGLTLPDAGMGTTITSREQRATIQQQGTRYLYEGGVSVSTARSHAWADSKTLGVSVPGSFLAGGAPLSESRSKETVWTGKSLIRSSFQGHVWTAGLTASHSADVDLALPNPAGLMQFESLGDYMAALSGSSTGIWSGERGNPSVEYASTSVAPFAETEIVRTRRAMLRGGLRLDYQARAGGAIAPRLAGALERAGFTIRGGGGVFVHDWQNRVFMQVIRGDASHLRHFLASPVSFADLPGLVPTSDPVVLLGIGPGLVRPRSLILQTSVERSLGSWTAGVEYRRTDSTHLLGSRRFPSETGWIDLLESNRTLRRQELRYRLISRWKSHSVVLHYARVRSSDNTDGPFSFPAKPDDLRSEWARSTGVAPHALDLVSTFQLPAAVSLSAGVAYRSSSPYNITSGLDPAGNFLYTDRAGRPRNSGDLPPYSSVSLFFHRMIELPYRPRSKERVHADIGFQIDNLLNNTNYVSFGSVIGSPLFGRPLTALPGRSARLWLTYSPALSRGKRDP